MFSLSPAKLLVLVVIALIVLGPDKLPQLARQLGSAWADLRKWRARLESDVRSNFPDLPSPQEVVQAVRSPLSFLDRLADAQEALDDDVGRNGSQENAHNGSRPGAVDGNESGPGEVRRTGVVEDGVADTSNGVGGQGAAAHSKQNGGPPPEARARSMADADWDWGFDDPSLN